MNTRPVPPSLDTAALAARADVAAASWNDAAIVPVLERAVAERPGDARAWQLLGLARRNLDDHAEALDAFRRAAALASMDPLIAHALARTTLEAGLPAVVAFDRALALAPLDAPVILGRAAAQFAAGDLAGAVEGLRAQLRRHPAWTDGHATAARLRWLAGEPARRGETFEDALAVRPRDGLLWREYAFVALRAGDWDALAAILARARAAVGASRTLDLIEAAGRSEAGDLSGADRLFAAPAPTPDAFAVLHARHLLRAGRPADVAAALEGKLAGDGARELLPLAMLAWRLTGDPRGALLARAGELVRVFDLRDEVGPIDALADNLRTLHRAVQAPLDQSVRGGTQTDGPLFARLDPPIRALRAAVLRAVGRYIDDLPPTVAGHPLLGERRGPLRFAGSWSVRLTGGGHHVEHVHPAGWISSALYVSVPDATADRAGWLALGDAPGLGLPLDPIAEVEPRPGRLVLFPSYLWHRTRPFPAGERLTVAFDIARAPR